MMDFYYCRMSAPCRGPLLTARALGVSLNLKSLALMEGEQMKPEFLAINPQHCVPTIVDGDFKLWESRAISAYLVNQYGKDDSLYPKDPKARALVDRMLYFDIGTLYHRFGNYVYPVIFMGGSADPENLQKIHEALGWLEGFLSVSDFAAGSEVTIADHALLASVTTIEASGIDISKYSNIMKWLARCKSFPGYEENDVGAKEFGGFAKSKLK